MADSVAKLQQEILSLTGVDIMLDADNFKSTYQILQEISEVWEDLTDVSRANVLNLLGGKRNANVLSSLISNFGDAQKAMATASNSAGSALAENEKYLDSIEGKTQKLKASFETMANAIINSNLVKAWIDIQRVVADTVTWLEKAGLLLPTIVSLASAIRAFQTASTAQKTAGGIIDLLTHSTNAEATIEAVKTALSGLGVFGQKLAGQTILEKLSSLELDDSLAKSIKEIVSETTAATPKLSSFSAIFDSLKTKAKGAASVLKSAFSTTVGRVGLAVTGLVTLITIAKNLYDSYVQGIIDRGNEAYTSTQDTISKSTAAAKELDKISDEFTKLSQGVDRYGNNVSLTDDEYARYLQLVQDIINITPSLQKAYTDKGSSLQTGYVDILEKANAEHEKFIKNAKEDVKITWKDTLAGSRTEVNQAYGTGMFGNVAGQNVYEPLVDIFSTSITMGVTEGAESAEDILKRTLGNDLYSYIRQVYMSDGTSIPIDQQAVYDLYQTSEKLFKAYKEAGADTTILSGIFGKLKPYADAYNEELTTVVDTMMLLAEVGDETSEAFARIAFAGQSDMFRLGLFNTFDPSDSPEDNYKALLSYITAFEDIQARMADLKQASAWQDVTPDINWLKEVYKDMPGINSIIDLIAESWSNTSNEEKSAADGVNEVIQSYENLEKVLSKISGFNTFLNNARNGKGSEDPFGMISAAKDVADAYNEIVAVSDDIPEIDWTNMVSEVGENGEILWSTSGIEYYIDAIINAAAANTEFAKNNPEVVAWLQQIAKGFDEAATSAKSLGDAMSSMESIDGLIKRINEYDGDDSEAFDIINELQKFVDEWNTILKAAGLEQIDITKFVSVDNGNVSFDNTVAALREFRDAVIGDNEAMQALKATSPDLYNIITTMGTQAEDAANGVLTLEDAISSLGDIASVLQEGIGGDTLADQITNAEKLAEGYNSVLRQLGDLGLTDKAADVGWREFLTIDDGIITENKARIQEYYTALVDLIVENMAKLYSLEGSEKASMKSSLLGWVTSQLDADEVKRKAEEIKDAFSEIKDITSYQADLASYRAGETSYFDMLERMYDLATQYDDIDLKDLWDFDTSAFKDIGDIQLDKMIDKLATDLEINEDEVEDWKNHVKKSFEEAEEAVSAYETATKSINLADSLNGFLADVRSGDKDPLTILSSAVSLAEDLGLKLEEVVSVGAGGKMTFNTDALTTAFEKYIDDLVTAGSLNEDLAAQIKNAAKAEGELAEEAQTAAERMADALSNMQSLYSFMQSGTAGDSDILTVLKNAQEQFNAYQDMVKDGLETTPLDIFSFITVDSSEIKENVNTAKKLYADMADQMINEWITETKKANAGKSGLTLLTGEEEWANGLTPEQAAWFNQIKTQILEHLEDLNAEVEPTVGDIISNLQSLYDFKSKVTAGEAVDFSTIYSDLETLRTILDNESLSLGDIIKWEDGDFKYAFSEISDIENAAEEAAESIARSILGITEATTAEEQAALTAMTENVKAALLQTKSDTEAAFDQLNGVISKVKTVSTFNETARSFRTGDTSFLDMLEESLSTAEALGLSLEEAFDFTTMQPNVEQINAALERTIDDLVESAGYSKEFANQLKAAARSAQQTQTIIDQYNNIKTIAGNASNYSRETQLTYEVYNELLSVDERYAQSIEYVNGKLIINRQRYNEVTDAIVEETAKTALLEAAQRKLKYEQLEKELKTNTELHADSRKEMEQQIAQLKLEANGFLVLANEISNATDQFERFNQASSNADASTYTTAQQAWKVINDTLYNAESDLYGRYGNEAFQEAIKLLIVPELDVDDPTWIEKVKDQVDEVKSTYERYFGDNKNGSRGAMYNFWQDLFDNDLASTFTGADGQEWGQLNTTIDEIADKFHMTKDAVRAALQELEMFSGVKFDWEIIDPEYAAQLAEAAAKAAELAEEAEAAKKAADEAAQKAAQAKADLEAAQGAGDEAAIEAAAEKAEQAQADAEAAKKAAEEAKAAAESAANGAAGDEADSTEQLKQNLNDILTQIEDIENNPIKVNADEAVTSTQSVIDQLKSIVELITKISNMNVTFGSGGDAPGDGQSGSVTAGGSVEYKLPANVKLIASAGTSDVVYTTSDGKLDIQKMAEQFIPEDYNGNVDLTNRVVIPIKMLADVGWTAYDDNGNEVDLSTEDGWATLFSNTITAGDVDSGYEFEYDQNVVINATPILANGDPLEPDAFYSYIDGLLQESMNSGQSVKELDSEGLNLVLSVDVITEGEDLDDSINKAVEYAQKIHELQEQWDQIRAENNFFGEADKYDPHGVFTSLTEDITAANTALTELSQAGEAGIDIKTSDGETHLGDLKSAAGDAKDAVDKVNGSQVDINTSPAISSIDAIGSKLSNIITKIAKINSMKLSPGTGGNSGSDTSDSGDSGARGIESASPGRTLVGEFGQEMVVDVKTGRWYTVGNNGPEMVNLPNGAIVYNAAKTAELLGKKRIDLSGLSMALGSKGVRNSSSLSGGRKLSGLALAVGTTAGTGKLNLKGLEKSVNNNSKKVTSAAETVSESADGLSDKLDSIKDAADEKIDKLEHQIEHSEQDYYVSERATNYGGMESALSEEAEYYKTIYKQAEKAVEKLKAAGGTDSDQQVQEMEETAWEAYKNMYEKLDAIRTLYTDALTEEIDNIQSAFSTLQDAIDEFNEDGTISIDTFQTLLENGIQYLAYLKNENGEYEISTENITALLNARKEQLAIETALSYVSKIREAVQKGETGTIASLVNAMQTLGTNTWDLVYANLELAKSEGLSDADYEKAKQNIDNVKSLAAVTQDDLNAQDTTISSIKSSYDSLNDEIEHYIEHLENAQDIAERGSDYKGIEESITAQIAEYQKIINNCNEAVDKMIANGADDTNSDLQDLEKEAWSAQSSIWSLYDTLYSLRVDAVKDRLNDVQSAISTFSSAIDEMNDSGTLTTDTFQSILENGLQYLQFLQIENGQLSMNTEAVEEMVRAKNEQLAAETAMSYLTQIEEAVLSGQANKVKELVTLTDDLSDSTWAAVDAKLALLKTEGLSDADAEAIESYIQKLRDLTSLANSDITASETEDQLTVIIDAFNETKEELEHYIAHMEQEFKESERSLDYSGMTRALMGEIDYYSQIRAKAIDAVNELQAAGADDTTSELQEAEEAAWSAYNSMNEAFDKMNALRMDALKDELDSLSSAYSNLESVVNEYDETGTISLKTFEQLLSGGIQYLIFLEKEDNQYKINTSALSDYISARKEQLAIENALSYIANIKQGLENNEVQRVSSLIDASNDLSTATWDLVFARAAELKTLGLTSGQYSTLISNLNKLRDASKNVQSDLSAGQDEEADQIKELANAFSDLNKELEHYIAHQEQAYKVAERAWDFGGMGTALQNEVGYYRRIIAESQKAIDEMVRAGADDTNEELQKLEATLWNASNSMYETLDKIRSLRVDALSDEIDNLSQSFNKFKSAADEYNKTGGITLDTFTSILEGGMQYLSLLDEENGQYVIAKDRLQDYIQMRKEQLAIETAISYLSEIREAMQNGERERMSRLIDATNGLSSSTWDLVYAQAAALKAEGLSNDQYKIIVGNIDKLRALAKSVNTDLTDAGEDVTEVYKDQQDALDQILKYTEDLIRAEAKDRIQAINDEIDAYKEIVELKKESLQQTKQETEYQDEVADKVKEIAQLQAKADLLSLDTSRTASAERQKLLQDIQDKQEELSKYQSDHAYDAQVEALDKEAEAYEESRQDEIAAIEASVSSEEKVYQLAIARIRDQWDTLYEDLINWNTEQGSVINQEITDAWESAFAAVQKYGDYLSALAGLKNDVAGISANSNLIVADIPKYHGGGVAGDKGRLNDEEVLAVLQKGELVVDKEQKKGLYAVVDFVKSLGERLGTKIGSLANLGVQGQMMPAFAGMAEPSSAGFIENNNITFNPSFNININGDVSDPSSAREYGRTLAQTAADSLFDAFNRRGINIVQTLRQ